MRKVVLMLSFLYIVSIDFAQQKDSMSTQLDLLRAPSSPGASLLNFAATDIERPSEVSSLMLSFSNATGGFTKIPSSYAIDFSPFWLLRKGSFTTDMLNSTKFKEVFRQTAVISIGFRNPDSTDNNFKKENLYSSFGFKFSLARGDYDAKTKETLNSIGQMQVKFLGDYHEEMENFRTTDTLYLRYKEQKRAYIKAHAAEQGFNPDNTPYDTLMSKLQAHAMDSLKIKLGQQLKAIQKLASGFKINRVGFFCDVAGGIGLEYINKTINSSVYNAGIWLNFGNNYESGFGFYGLFRYLYQPKKSFTDDKLLLQTSDLQTFDAGGKAAFNQPGSDFCFSAEAIYRSALTSGTVKPTYKLLVNAEYDIGVNKKLSFTFGRDFDGTITRSSNLIAGLNFLTGFGNNR